MLNIYAADIIFYEAILIKCLWLLGNYIKPTVYYKNFHNWNLTAPEKKTQGDKKGWSGEGKRTDDRVSGTGKNAHNKYEKKGGAGGKGNWGTENTDVGEDAAKENDESKKEVIPEEPAEPVLTLDDYLKENNLQLQTKIAEGEKQGTTLKTAEKGFKVLAKKEKDYVEAECGRNRNVEKDKIAQVGVSNIQGVEPQEAPRRGGKGQGGQRGGKRNNKLSDDDFPTLS